MAPTAIQIAQQIADAYESGMMQDTDDPHLDTLELAAHLLTMPLSHGAEAGRLSEFVERWRTVLRQIVTHEDLPTEVLAVLGDVRA